MSPSFIGFGDMSPSSSTSSSPRMLPVDISEDLTPLPILKAAATTQIDFEGVLSQPLKLHEDVRTGCGGQTWPAGLVLGKHMLRYHRGKLDERKMLELGAGGGLVGLAVALESDLKSPMLVTDQDEMFELIRHNIKLNGLQSKAQAMVLNWGESLPAQVLEQKPDVILAAECVYFEPAFPLLMETLKALLELNQDAIVYFCFKKRRRADLQFIKMAKKAFHVEEIFDQDRPIFQRQGLFLFTFTSKKKSGSSVKGSTRLATNGDSRIHTVAS